MKIAAGTRTTPLGLAVAGALLLSGCGGGESQASTDDEIASLDQGDGGDAEPAESGDAATPADAEEAGLEFSACLRAGGFDVPDIGVDADGNINLRDAVQDVDRSDASFRETMEGCREILEGVGFGGGGRGQIADNPEIADAFLEFSDCIREQGFEDVADLTFGQPGQGDEADEGQGPREGGQGEREGGFGDRNARFAEQLGLDAEDPDVTAALDTCSPIIDQAFADAGAGGPAGGGNG